MDKDLISVIVPVYNSAQYLERCIQSICVNTYKKLEIILIDDGSIDESGDICDKYTQKDERISVWHNENNGVSYTRNFGLDKAKGEYISFIDSDDYIDDKYFECLYKTIIQEKSDMSICKTVHKYQDNVVSDEYEDFLINLAEINNKNIDKFYLLNKTYYLYGPCNKLYRSNIIRNNNIKFPLDTSYGEDLLFNFGYLQFCEKICFINDTFYIYNHDNESSLSHKYRSDLFENGLKLNLSIRSFSEDIGYYSQKMRKFWANRVFDDVYNSLFELFDSRCELNNGQKIKRISYLLNHKYFIEALKDADISEYSRFYVDLMKKKAVYTFVVIMMIRKKIKL